MTTVVGICGGSAAGKSVFSKILQSFLSVPSLILSMDHYYADIGPISVEERMRLNFDEPSAFDIERLVHDIRLLREGSSIEIPNYDYEKCCRLGYSAPVSAEPIILVEGIFLLSSDEIYSSLDYSIFLEVTETERRKRRLERDTVERHRTTTMVLDQWNFSVLPMHYRFIEPHKSKANRIVDNSQNDLTNLRWEAQRVAESLEKIMRTSKPRSHPS